MKRGRKSILAPNEARARMNLLPVGKQRHAAFLKQAEDDLERVGLAKPEWVTRPLEAPEWSAEARDRFKRDVTRYIQQRHGRPSVLQEGLNLRLYAEDRTHWIHRLLGRLLACYAILKAVR